MPQALSGVDGGLPEFGEGLLEGVQIVGDGAVEARLAAAFGEGGV